MALDDAEAVQQLKKQAARVYFEAIAIAVVTIAVVMLARGLLESYVPMTGYGPE